MRRGASRLGHLFLGASLVVALITAMARVSATAELVANLRWPLGLSGVIAAAAYLFGRRPLLALLGMVVGLLLVWPNVSLRWGSSPRIEGAVLRVASVNLLFGRVEPHRVEAFLDEFDPDVVGLLEVLQENRTGTDWFQVLERWRERYPHQVVLPHGYSFGMALLSRHPLEGVRAVEPEGGENIYAHRPALLEAVARIGGEPVRILLAHPERPGRAWRTRARARVFEEVVRRAGQEPVLVLGDLNCTEGSPLFQDLLDGAGLVDSRRGFGPCPTWAHHMVPGRWVTLDHVLVRGLGVLERGVGPDLGSDHLPATAVLTLGGDP